MKQFFYDIQRRLLLNNPVLWITSIYWVVGVCLFLILIETIIGILAKFAADLTGFYLSAMLVVVVLLFLWISFQYRNYDKIFTIRQTFKIYFYNILTYIVICISSLVLVVIMTVRFHTDITPREFSQDLLSLRIANLRDSDIDFIKKNPQLFTSIGSSSGNDQTQTVDLEAEFNSRQRLERNPLIKSNLSSNYNILRALQKQPGFEYLDSLMTAAGSNSNFRYSIYQIDEDPIFYKYILSLSPHQRDSLRDHSKKVVLKYGLDPAPTDTTEENIKTYFNTLLPQVYHIVGNSEIPKDHIYMTVISLLIICSITFSFILTKNILCLFTPFVYVSLVVLGAVLMEPLLSAFRMGAWEDFLAIIFANIILAIVVMIALRWRTKIYSKSLLFFFQQMQNLSALAFFIIVFIYAADDYLFPTGRSLLFTISIGGFLLTHLFFIRKMHQRLIQEV